MSALKWKDSCRIRCLFAGCPNNVKNCPNKRFFGFPDPDKKPHLFQQWIVNTKSTKVLDSTAKNIRHKKVCEDHFKRSSFNYKKNRLKPNAVPQSKEAINEEDDHVTPTPTKAPTKKPGPFIVSKWTIIESPFKSQGPKHLLYHHSKGPPKQEDDDSKPPLPSHCLFLDEKADDSQSETDEPLVDTIMQDSAMLDQGSSVSLSPNRNKGNTSSMVDQESCQCVDGSENSEGDDLLEIPASIKQILDRPAGVMKESLDLFGKYITSILNELPISRAYKMQKKFLDEAITARLNYESQHPSDPPSQSLEPPPDESQPPQSTNINLIEDNISTSTNNTANSKKRSATAEDSLEFLEPHSLISSNPPEETAPSGTACKRKKRGPKTEQSLSLQPKLPEFIQIKQEWEDTSIAEEQTLFQKSFSDISSSLPQETACKSTTSSTARKRRYKELKSAQLLSVPPELPEFVEVKEEVEDPSTAEEQLATREDRSFIDIDEDVIPKLEVHSEDTYNQPGPSTRGLAVTPAVSSEETTTNYSTTSQTRNKLFICPVCSASFTEHTDFNLHHKENHTELYMTDNQSLATCSPVWKQP